MPPRVTDEHLSFARKLRAQMSTAETILWRSRRNRGIEAKFRRQVPIGPYFADFACVAARLVVELDGAPHDAPERKSRDLERDAWLIEHGWRVLRFPNEIVLGGGDLVLDEIKRMLSESPHPTSLREATFSRAAGEGFARMPDKRR
jgi:very-short-patch-repair endonuclease